MTQDTRKDRRVKIVSLNVRYKSATVDEFIENHAYDVSRGGIFIKTANPFPPGTLLKFEIRLASEQAVIAGVGRIVWKRDTGSSSTERPAGMGVKFIKLDEPSKIVIDRLVNTKADAGRAYEAEEPARMVSERPVPRATPTARPEVSAPIQSRVPGARSMSPAGGIAAAGRSPSIGAGGPLRKQTMMGVGASSVPAAPSSSPALAGLPSTVPPAARPSFPAAPSAPPRPGGGPTPMFPKGNRESDWAPKQEPTVMKQAAELLEEALREAGGSMEEIGTNPLFSSSGSSTSSAADFAKAPAPAAREWTTSDAAPPEPQITADSRKPPVTRDEPVSTPAPPSPRLTPTSDRPTSAVASEPPPAKKKSGAGVVIFWLVAAAAVIGVVVMFRDQLIGAAAPPEPVSAPPAAQTAQAPASAANTSTVASGSASASASAASSAAQGSPSASASAQPSTSASIDKAATPQKSAPATSVAAPVAPAPPPRQWRPAAKPAAPAAAAAAAGDTNAQTSAPTEAAPTTATAQSAPAAPPVKVAPPPRPKPAKPSDDNPY